jgi:hypothetical protein
MVVRGGVTIELVDAAAKIPFKEHTKDGEVYVEVEPDAEYFIKLAKNEKTRSKWLELTADGTDLGYYVEYLKDGCHSEGLYGLRSVANGIESDIALKFVEPPRAKKGKVVGTGASVLPPMGSVKLDVYKVVSGGYRKIEKRSKSEAKEIQPVTMSAWDDLTVSDDIEAKKLLRSAKGTTTLTWGRKAPAKTPDDRASRERRKVYERGDLVDTIVLHYGTAAGLLKAGVLETRRGAVQPPVAKKQKCADSKKGALHARAGVSEIAAVEDPGADGEVQLLEVAAEGPAIIDLTSDDDADAAGRPGPGAPTRRLPR